MGRTNLRSDGLHEVVAENVEVVAVIKRAHVARLTNGRVTGNGQMVAIGGSWADRPGGAVGRSVSTVCR